LDSRVRSSRQGPAGCHHIRAHINVGTAASDIDKTCREQYPRSLRRYSVVHRRIPRPPTRQRKPNRSRFRADSHRRIGARMPRLKCRPACPLVGGLEVTPGRIRTIVEKNSGDRPDRTS
jgi:hypothetical protein